jgi:hypothetical protein
MRNRLSPAAREDIRDGAITARRLLLAAVMIILAFGALLLIGDAAQDFARDFSEGWNSVS